MKEPKYVRIMPPDSAIDAPFTIPMEIVLILWDKKDLLAMYINFMFLARTRGNFILKQPDLAKILGFSYIFYLKKRKELVELGLLKVEVQRNNFTEIGVCTGKLWGLYKIYRGSLENIKTPLVFNTLQEMQDYIDRTGKSLIETSKKYSSESYKSQFLDNIYNINNNNNNIVENNENKKKEIGKTYPRADYNLILDAFKKYKGINLVGPEIAYHMKAIKMMFQAERKVEEIIAFMKWLYDNQRNEETPWVKTWTIWTVQKKIAEFVAGKLDVSTEKEELERV